jgi:hypothetical protein
VEIILAYMENMANLEYFAVGCPRNFADSEFRLYFYFRLFRIPCGIGCNSGGIPPNSVSYNSVKFRGISRNSVTFFMYRFRIRISPKRHIKVYSIHRVPECLSLRWNWVPPRPPPQASVSPLWTQRGGATLACG